MKSIETSNMIILKRLFREHILTYKRRLGYACLCMIIAALSTAALPFLIKDVFDDVFTKGDIKQLIIFCGTVLLAFICKGLASYGESVLMTWVGQKVISDIQNRLFKHLMQLDLLFFHNTTTGELLSRFTNDVNLMRNAFANTTLSLGKDSITLFALIALMFYRDPTLAAISFFVFPAAVLPIIKIGRRMKKVTFNTQEITADLTNQLTQIFQGMRVIKSYGTEAKEANRAEGTISNIFSLIYKATRIRCAAHPIIETMGGVAIITVIGYGGWQVAHNDRTTGDFISFILALILAYEPLKRLSNLNANLQEGLSASSRVFDVLDVQPHITSPKNAKMPLSNEHTITFDKTTFMYEGGKVALDNLNFKIESGQTVAFVGPSGAGKSSLINLLPRFYDVTKGRILYNDIPLQDYDLNFLRKKMGLVSQEITLFDMNIYDNIAYGVENATMEQVIEAAQKAAADDFITELSDGYQTMIGENGVRLSGGQRQRIAIARAMLKNAPILLLDEATSALDTESEKKVQAALDILMEGRTTLMVAHRLSTVVNADVIYVLDKGKIAESGDHQTLINHQGIYANLWAQQSKK
ncbi:MAG TPA: ABC transporter permease [Holosporales bacterium]|nr:ABC transporter permease [Holosporales bacterium]